MSSEEWVVGEPRPLDVDQRQRRALLDIYDAAVPAVYGYLKPRCGDEALAEDLTAETFLSACDSVERGTVDGATVGWLIGIARHKLVDHWRREERHQRRLQAVAGLTEDTDDPWDLTLDAMAIERTLASLSPLSRVALTLRYLDGLPVGDVARMLERTVPATDQILARARRAFRSSFGDER